MNACLGKTWAKTFFLQQNRIVTILWKQIFQQVVGGAIRKSEITAISNKLKDILDDFIDSSNTEFQDKLEPIDKSTCNPPRSQSTIPNLLEKNCLDKDILDMSLEWMSKTWEFQIYKDRNIVPFDSKNRKT